MENAGPQAYLDHAASTPARPEVVEAMVPWLADHPGNPSGPMPWPVQLDGP